MRTVSYTCDVCDRAMTEKESDAQPRVSVERPRSEQLGSGAFSPHMCGDCVGRVVALMGPGAARFLK
jgi:hypothetical protein